MMKRFYGRGLGISLGIILIGCFALAWGWAEYAQAEENGLQPVGKIERTQGATMVMRAGTTDFVPISQGEPVFVQDTIGTAPTDASAKMWWRNPSPVHMDASLGRDSLLGFESFSQEGPSSSFVGSVSRGMVRLIRKVPVTQPESSFTTVSPTALIQVIPGGDRAADYVVSVLDDEHTSVTVIWGAVAVRNVSDQTTQIRQVTSCQMVIVEKDKEPSEVMPVGSDTLRELINLTTIPGTLPTSVPSCTPPSEPVPPDEYIPPEPPEVIEMIPGEPGEIGPPGFVPIPFPPGDGYTGTIDTTDTTPTDTTSTDTTSTDTTPTDTTSTDTTPTITFPTITFPTITFLTFTFPPPTFTVTFEPPTFTFTFSPTLIDTSVIDTGTGIGSFTFSPTLIDTSVIDTGTGVIGTFTFSPTLIDTSVIDTGTGIGSFTFSPTLIDTSVIDTGTGGVPTFTFSPTLIDTSVIDTGTGGIGTITFSPTFIDTGAGISTVSTVFSGFTGGTGQPFIQTFSTGSAPTTHATQQFQIHTFSTGSAPTTHDRQMEQLHMQQKQLQHIQQNQFKPRPGF